MKKLFLSLMLITLLPFSLRAEVIWSGDTEISWNTGTFVTVGNTSFLESTAGDQLVFKIEFIGQTDWPQLSIMNGSWKELPGAGNTPLKAGITEVSYYITAGMLKDFQQSGLLVTGVGYRLKQIELIKGDGGNYDDYVWMGRTVFNTDWSTYLQVPASTFSSAKTGCILRFHVAELQAGAQLLPKNSCWGELTDAPGKALQSIYVDYTITQNLLSEIQKNGMIIQGVGYTLTGIELIDPNKIPELTYDVPVTNKWLWTGNNKPTITIRVTNPTENEVQVNAKLVVKTDKMKDYCSIDKVGKVAAKSNTNMDIAFDAAPGFYHVTALVNGEIVKSFVIGNEPEQVVSAPDYQPDFHEFWTSAKNALAQIPMNATLTEIPAKSTARRKVYLLEMKSLPLNDNDEAIVRAYFAEPTTSGIYPAIIHYQGYDGGTYEPWCMGGDDNPNFVEIIPATRGQLINNRSPYKNTYGDWFQYGFGNQDTYYYKGAYMDVVRIIDFLVSREKVDKENIFAEGASQGGAFTLAAAALDHRLKAIAPSIPFMGDFPDYFQVASWPANVAFQQQSRLGLSNEQLYTFLSYFDTKNLATMITCPVYMAFSLQDDVCPPHTNIAPFNNLPANVEKQYFVNPTGGHETPSSWYNIYMDFFKKHITTGIETINHSSNSENNTIYNIQGVKVKGKSMAKGIYINHGRKYVVR